jgi:hypothetical protein
MAATTGIKTTPALASGTTGTGGTGFPVVVNEPMVSTMVSTMVVFKLVGSTAVVLGKLVGFTAVVFKLVGSTAVVLGKLVALVAACASVESIKVAMPTAPTLRTWGVSTVTFILNVSCGLWI